MSTTALAKIINRMRKVAQDAGLTGKLPTDAGALAELAIEWWTIYRRSDPDLARTPWGVVATAADRKAADGQALTIAIELGREQAPTVS